MQPAYVEMALWCVEYIAYIIHSLEKSCSVYFDISTLTHPKMIKLRFVHFILIKNLVKVDVHNNCSVCMCTFGSFSVLPYFVH